MNLEYFESKHKKLQEEYESLCDSTLPMMELDNVVVSKALKNQIHLQFVWESLVRELSHLHDFLESELEGLYSETVEDELKDSYRSSTISEAREFAKANKEYRTAKRLLLSIQETRDISKGILETITSRKYVLNNLSNLIIHGSDGYIL